MEQETYIDSGNFNKSTFGRFVIVGNIGVERTCMAIMGIKSKMEYAIIFKRTVLTKDLTHVHELLNDCLKHAYDHYGIEIGRAVLSAAGPVSRKRGYIKLTNANFTVIAQDVLNNSLLHKVILLNDFEAIGYGLDLLDMSKDVTLISHVGEDNTTPKNLSNTFAAIGAGSGLGVSIAYVDKTKHIHIPLPSEGGHLDFSVQTPLEFELLQYLKENVLSRTNAHPEFERVLSEKGLINIYNFIRLKELYPDSTIVRQIDALDFNGKLQLIARNLEDPTCKMTVDLFIKFYATAARDMALLSECYSGLFITGNLASTYEQFFTNGTFMKEFELHDQRTDVLRKVPVYLIKNKDIGLYGCCNVAINFYDLL